MENGTKVTLDVEALALVREALDRTDGTDRARLAEDLRGAPELPGDAAHVVERGLTDVAVTLLAERDSSVWMVLNEPPPARRSRRWRDEYVARVRARLVSLVGLHLYVEHHHPWTFTDNLVLPRITRGWAEEAIEAAPPDGGVPPWSALLERVRAPTNEAVRDYVAWSPHQRPETRQFAFDTSLSPLVVPTEDAALREQLLEGLFPARPVEGVITQEWRGYEQATDGDHRQPSVRVTLGDAGIARIEVGVGGAAGEFPFRATPADGGRWAIAKHCVRVSNLLEGQLRGHLGRGHVGTETYRLAFERVGDGQSPVWPLLRPFLHFVREIDDLGDPLIFGEGSIIERSGALTPRGVVAVLEEVLNEERWDRWTPPHREAPRREGRYGRAAAAFSEGLEGFVSRYLEEHRAAVLAHWGELDAFVEALGDARAAPSGRPWRAARTDPLPPQDLDALERLLMHAIFHATFFHTWSNDRQWSDAGDPAKVAFALRAGVDDVDGATSYEAWRRDATPVAADAWLQMTLADVLSHTTYGQLGDIRESGAAYQDVLTDGDRRILDALHQSLEPHADALAAAGLPLDRLRAFVAI